MDGVTDTSMRAITARYGRPAVTLTEFVPVEALVYATEKFMIDLQYSEEERPVVAQFYGKDPHLFYQAAVVAGALGFDGVDVNMGCPAKSVTQRGCGAALIENPTLAKEIVRAVQAGAAAWANGCSVDALELPPKALAVVKRWLDRRGGAPDGTARKLLPVSVKTRLGVSNVVVEDWIKHLMEVEPAAVTIHGRTLKQLYGGEANWEAIGRAARLAAGSGTRILGNGDVKSLAEAQQRAEQYGTDGVLIGRAAIGNPWVFTAEGATLRDRFRVAMEHVRALVAGLEHTGEPRHFVRIRRHLHRYCRGFPGAAELRKALMLAPTPADCLRLLSEGLTRLEDQGLADRRVLVEEEEQELLGAC